MDTETLKQIFYVRYSSLFEGDIGIDLIREIPGIFQPMRDYLKKDSSQSDGGTHSEKKDRSQSDEISKLKEKIKILEDEKRNLNSDYKKITENVPTTYPTPEMENEKIKIMEDKIKVLEQEYKILKSFPANSDEGKEAKQIENEINTSKLDLLRAIRSKGKPVDSENIKYKLSRDKYKEKMHLDKELLNFERKYTSKYPTKNPLKIREFAFDHARKEQILDEFPELSEKEAKNKLKELKDDENSLIDIIIGDNARHREILKNIRLNALHAKLAEENPELDNSSSSFADFVLETYDFLEEKWKNESSTS